MYMILPLLILPERADAVLLAAGLELLAHLVRLRVRVRVRGLG